MKPVLRRIALHGGLTALLLSVIGFMFAELASIWLAASPGIRTATGDPVAAPDSNGAMTNMLRNRLPLLMAVWGFLFIAVGELALYFWRGEKKPKAAPLRQPDETEKRLAELLRQAEATSPQGSRASSHEADALQSGSQPEAN